MSQTASQALARKWRPRDFDSLVGQEHVVKALSHALQTQRLHHAYLLTGTRGVGKTTIARILAKAVNCENGVSANPCGQCRACTEIAQGRFVDLLEVDAATNTRVEEMRQLLENAAYAPTAGRYKVYVIDEVHMLSNSSFNAMLKTLEEPPGHILFILATTDPQKIPPTVLSRCLQFGLRQLVPDQIAHHLASILDQEGIQYEPLALRIIAKAARGSLRDALSLTDQAIAYSAGQLSEASVRQMLGSVDQQVIVDILRLLAAKDGVGLTKLSDGLAAQSAPFAALLDELASASYRLSIAALAGGLRSDDPDEVALSDLQSLFSPEDLQLFYQIATHARSELHLAPEEHIGFGMALIRMMCFRPGGRGLAHASTESGSPSSGGGSGKSTSTAPSAGGMQVPSAAPARGSSQGASPSAQGISQVASRPAGDSSLNASRSAQDRSQSESPSAVQGSPAAPAVNASSSLEEKTRAMMNATKALLAIRDRSGSEAAESGARSGVAGGSGQQSESRVKTHLTSGDLQSVRPINTASTGQSVRSQPDHAQTPQAIPVQARSASDRGNSGIVSVAQDSSADEDDGPPWDDTPPIGNVPVTKTGSNGNTPLIKSIVLGKDTASNVDSLGHEPPPWGDIPPLGESQSLDSNRKLNAADASAGFPSERRAPVETAHLGTTPAGTSFVEETPAGTVLFDTAPEVVQNPHLEPVMQTPPAQAAVSLGQFQSIEGLPTPDQWPDFSQCVPATGLVRQALVQTELLGWQEQEGTVCAQLVTQIKTWLNPGMPEKLEQAISSHLGRRVRLELRHGEVSNTASLNMQEVRRLAQMEAKASLDADPFLVELQESMGAKIVEGSLRPLYSHGPADV